jgi:hypothetical protein
MSSSAVPFNIASYALLTMMVARVTGLQPGDFVHTLGDAHLYLIHLDQARLQLSREPRPLPSMRINPNVQSIFDFTYEDFTIEKYAPHRPSRRRLRSEPPPRSPCALHSSQRWPAIGPSATTVGCRGASQKTSSDSKPSRWVTYCSWAGRRSIPLEGRCLGDERSS